MWHYKTLNEKRKMITIMSDDSFISELCQRDARVRIAFVPQRQGWWMFVYSGVTLSRDLFLLLRLIYFLFLICLEVFGPFRCLESEEDFVELNCVAVTGFGDSCNN